MSLSSERYLGAGGIGPAHASGSFGSATKPSLPGADAVWIAWEDHRRSRELAMALGAELKVLQSRRSYLIRACVLSVRSFRFLVRRRPRLVVVQNPSLVLAGLACALKRILRYQLVVDRHSNFELISIRVPRPVRVAFRILSRYTLRQADLTIVTNRHLADLVEAVGGRSCVLPDKLPRLEQGALVQLPARNNLVFVCSFAADEPLAEVLESAHLLDPDTIIHVTGDYRCADPELVRRAPANVSFRGYLSEADYQSLLLSCTAVLALTKNAHTLLCCAYEAVALHRPLILSDHEALRVYFREGAVYCGTDPVGISLAIKEAICSTPRLAREMESFATKLEAEWREDFANLKKRLDTLAVM